MLLHRNAIKMNKLELPVSTWTNLTNFTLGTISRLRKLAKYHLCS